MVTGVGNCPLPFGEGRGFDGCAVGWITYEGDVKFLRTKTAIGFCAVHLGAAVSAFAQDLEPRRWSDLPVGANFAGLGYAFTDGDIAFDPVLQLDDVQLDLHTLALKYTRTLDFFNKAARIEFTLPYQDARWEGLLQGEPAAADRSGFADPWIRFAVNLIGAPPLEVGEFAKFQAERPVNTIAGISLAAQLPLGEYFPEKLLNLGENRFTIRPSAGVVHNRGPWSFELTGAMDLFTDNNDFFGGNTREQDPLYSLQSHIVHTFRPGLWFGAGTAYRFGGATRVNGIDKNDERGDWLWGASVGYPINPALGVKLGYIHSHTTRANGLDAHTLVLAMSYYW